MATVKISELSAAASALSTDQIPVNQSGVTKRITVGQIRDAVSTAVNTLSTAVDAVSNAISNEISVRGASVDALSIAVSLADATLSARIDTASALGTTADAHASAVSIAADIISVALANEILARQAMNVLSLQNVDASAISAGFPVYEFTSAQTIKRATGLGNAASKCIGVVIDSAIAVSAIGRVQTFGSVTLTTGQWDSVTGQSGGLTVGSQYFLDFGVPTFLNVTAPGFPYVVGVAISTTTLQLTIMPNADLSGEIISLRNRCSIISSKTSVLSVSDTSLDGRITSVEGHADIVSAAVVALATSVETLSAKVVSISAQLVSLDGRATSINSKISVTSSEVAALAASVETLSTKVVSICAQATSINAGITSLDNRATSLAASDTSLDGRITSLLCVAISAVSNRLSAAEFPSNAVNTAVSKVRRVLSVAATVIASAAVANVTGLSISVKTGGVYKFEAFIMLTRQGVAMPMGFALTFPAMTAARGRMIHQISLVQSLPTASSWQLGMWGGGDSGVVLISTSASQGALASSYLDIKGVFVPSADGVIQLQARAAGGASAMSITVGSYMETEKIG